MIRLSELLPNTSSASSSWSITKKPDPCSWNGVTCTLNSSSSSSSSSSSYSITNLSLSNFGLSNSTFLPIICQIDTIESIDLSNNHFTSIPDVFITDCGEIAVLKLLNFSRNRLDGSLPTFHGFVGLQFLDLSYNLLKGNVDLQFDGLVGLRSLNISFNNFNGPAPTHLGNSMLLEQLVLSKNTFKGGLHENISDYRNLNLIDLSNNRLSGSLPSSIGELSKLEVLILSSNEFSGAIPNALSNIATLSRFAANLNSFSGTIPTGISRSLRNLDLSYNNLSGSIPWDLLSHPNLQTVDLSYNSLEGSVPGNLSESLVRLRLGSNALDGTIPSATLGTLQKLTYLELDNNSLSGSIPPELGLCKSLALLNLAKNRLTGVLPVQLGNLSHLQVLKLQFNKLVGEIPVQLTQLHSLSTLNISWNSLSGSIPDSISSLQNLVNLNLEENNISGPIPSSIASLDSLLELQLGKNQLSGNIPLMPTRLQIALNLSSNLLEGQIPSTLSRVTGLEVLDLSNNKFSGKIPDFLTQMDSLTQLLLYNNQLTGDLPKFKSWVNVNITGNKVNNATGSTDSPSIVPKKRKSVTLTVTLAVVAAVFAVGIVAVISLSLSRRFYRVNNEISQSAGEDLPSPQVIQCNLLTANGIHRSRIDFTKAIEAVVCPANIMLKSRFSTYYKAVMPSGTSYFVKKMNWSDKIFQTGSHEKFAQELEVLGKLTNSNVMTPLAYVLTTDCAYLIYEFAQKGTLFDVLHGSLGNALDWASRYSIAVGVAQGLAFLHGCTSSGPILLLDLSSKSIMLKSLKEPQIGDIELFKVIDPSKSTGSLSTIAGSVGYVPPEYAYTMRITTAGNVYSFGVVLLELLTGKPAVSEGIELAKWALSKSLQQEKWDHILDFNVGGASSLAVKGQMLGVLKVALACVSVSPEARPKMKSVLRMLLNAR